MKNRFSLVAAITVSILISTFVFFGEAYAGGSVVTRDANYIYVSTPLPLTFDEVQQSQIKEGMQMLLTKLAEINMQNPRKTWRDKVVGQLTDSAKPFETELDTIIGFTQKYYGEKVSPGLKPYNALPTGVLIFSGVEVTASGIASAGGSVMLGSVIVPVRIDVYDIDTEQKIDSYLSADSALVVWPSANIGLGVGGGANARIGTGLIWGELQKASDFQGLVFGASGTVSALVGQNVKLQYLKNWSKAGAVNNTFFTMALESGVEAKVEIHGNISYIISAQSFLNTTGSAFGVIMNKIGLTSDGKPK